MVFVFDTTSPSPRTIGPHKQNFPGTKRSRYQQRHATVFIGSFLVDGQHVGTRFGAGDGSVPLKPWQVFPNLHVVVLRVRQLSQQTAPPQFRQRKVTGLTRTPTVDLGAIEHNRQQIIQRRIRK